MDKVAQLPAQDRSDLCRAAADAKGVTVQLIEKDFWVCWVLRHLYDLPDAHPSLLFKGGTSLSKVFGVIERMSEDIDLVIDKESLGYTGDKDPAAEGLSNKARGKLTDALKADAAEYVAGPLTNALRDRFIEVLGDTGGWTLEADVSNHDNTTVEFCYPSTEDSSPYLKPMVLLELGARGDTTPAVKGTIQPYAAQSFPGPFDAPSAAVRAITAGRTFWEKATYLHALAHQGKDKIAAAKPARHYYDLHQLLQHDLGREALTDVNLLADVVRHKSMFYRQASARYDLAVPGSLRLIPDKDGLTSIRTEYTQMAEEMVFGDAPGFDEVIDTLASIESLFNSLKIID